MLLYSYQKKKVKIFIYCSILTCIGISYCTNIYHMNNLLYVYYDYRCRFKPGVQIDLSLPPYQRILFFLTPVLIKLFGNLKSQTYIVFIFIFQFPCTLFTIAMWRVFAYKTFFLIALTTYETIYTTLEFHIQRVPVHQLCYLDVLFIL